MCGPCGCRTGESCAKQALHPEVLHAALRLASLLIDARLIQVGRRSAQLSNTD
jgi:hypothetical protein